MKRSSATSIILLLIVIFVLLIRPASNLAAALFSNFGYGAYVRGAQGNARQWFELATRIDDDSFTAWHGLGQVNTKQGNIAVALLAYDRALFLNPDDIQARLDCAEVRLLLGDKDGAISDWKATGSLDALLWLGHQALAEEDDVGLATRLYQLAVQVAPQDWHGYYYLGAVLKEQKLLADAEQALLAGLNVSPDNSSILLRLGQTRCLLQRYAGAMQSLSNYIELRPDDFRGWYWRGLCNEETGAMLQALHDFREAAVKLPFLVPIESRQIHGCL